MFKKEGLTLGLQINNRRPCEIGWYWYMNPPVFYEVYHSQLTSRRDKMLSFYYYTCPTRGSIEVSWACEKAVRAAAPELKNLPGAQLGPPPVTVGPFEYPGLTMGQDAQRRSGFFGDKLYWRKRAYQNLEAQFEGQSKLDMTSREKRMLLHMRRYIKKRIKGHRFERI